MQFTVPKFVEHEPKVLWRFTFWQFMVIGGIAIFAFILYSLAPFYIFVLGLVFGGGGALVVMFARIEGRPLPTVAKNFLMFKVRPQIYLWRTRQVVPKYILEKPKPVKEEKEEPSTPKIGIALGSRLKKLATKIEMKTK